MATAAPHPPTPRRVTIFPECLSPRFLWGLTEQGAVLPEAHVLSFMSITSAKTLFPNRPHVLGLGAFTEVLGGHNLTHNTALQDDRQVS